MAEQTNSLAGRTFRWTFKDKPTANKTYEHVFSSDGTVVFKEVNGTPQAGPSGEKAPGIKYASFRIAPNTHLVSYLSNHGYTLTVAMNLDNKELHGFASNDKEWYPLTGTLEVVKRGSSNQLVHEDATQPEVHDARVHDGRNRCTRNVGGYASGAGHGDVQANDRAADIRRA